MGSFIEQFSRTERTLARHPAGIKERFIDALMNGVANLNHDEREKNRMPRYLRQDFEEFMSKVTVVSGSDLPGEGAIHGTIKQMSDSEVQILVDEFLALSYEIARLPKSKYR